MRYPWVNVVLLVLLAVQLMSGFVGLISGSGNLDWYLQIHSIVGYTIALMLICNTAIQ